MHRTASWLKGLLAFAALVVFGLIALISCRGKETDLPFETIAQGEGFWTGQDYSEVDPDLLVLASSGDVDAPGRDIQFGSELAEQLRAVDYNDRFVIVVLRGQLGGMSPSYAIDVLQVTRSGDRVIVRTHFGELGPEQGVLMSFSSPYYILTVPKADMSGQKVRFILEEDGQTVRERTHFIP
jgi:hypothetical protein